jgi:hypothetical protein
MEPGGTLGHEFMVIIEEAGPEVNEECDESLILI